MTRIASLALTTLCLMAAFGARAQVTVNYSDSRNFYSPEYAGYVASRGPIPTVVHNAPFGPAGAQAVAARMPVPGFLGRASFQAAEGPQALPYDRLVVAFDPVPGTNSTQLCRDPDVGGGAHGSRTHVLAVLCRGAYPTSEAALGAPLVRSPDDPVFRELLSQIALAVFPSQNRDAGGNCNRVNC
jgi:hypothetical protein